MPYNYQSDDYTFIVKITSKLLNAHILFEKKFTVKEILDKRVLQKAFSYYLESNFLITFFEGDNYFLYFLYEFSAI